MMWPADTAPNLVLCEGAQVGSDVRFGANVTVHEGTLIGDGERDRRRRGARQAADALAPLDRLP